jgi:hypothetical protein
MIGEQTVEVGAKNLKHVDKLSRTFTALLDALNRHRGKGHQNGHGGAASSPSDLAPSSVGPSKPTTHESLRKVVSGIPRSPLGTECGCQPLESMMTPD